MIKDMKAISMTRNNFIFCFFCFLFVRKIFFFEKMYFFGFFVCCIFVVVFVDKKRRKKSGKQNFVVTQTHTHTQEIARTCK
jgi:uncharacterized membrane protein YiaA